MCVGDLLAGGGAVHAAEVDGLHGTCAFRPNLPLAVPVVEATLIVKMGSACHSFHAKPRRSQSKEYTL
eukprot:COSAG05_NODE_264_length_12674_cov_6.768111_3_plen_68_part_00